MTVIMDGEVLAKTLKGELARRVKSLRKKGIKPTLVTVLIGEDPSSKTYVRLKGKDCEEVGIDFKLRNLPAEARESEVLELLSELNEDRGVSGISVQLPVPPHLDKKCLISRINPQKDVDGLHPLNVGKLWVGDYDFEDDLLPCTPKGIMKLLDHYEIELRRKMAVIINRSDLVGKPLSKLLLDRDATVTVCHSKTSDLERCTKEADVLVSAVGRRPNFEVTPEMVKEGAVVVDVGMSYVDGKLYGDVDFEGVKGKASYITPTPGGVGPMTRVMLLSNTLIAAGMREIL